MAAYITCPAKGELRDMSECRNCYYKRHPIDLSTVFCKWKVKAGERRARQARIEHAEEELDGFIKEQERLFTAGHPDKAILLSGEIEKSRRVIRDLKVKGKVVDEIHRQSMEVNQPIIKIAEEILTRSSALIAQLKPEDLKTKTLHQLYTFFCSNQQAIVEKCGGAYLSRAEYEIIKTETVNFYKS